jgi:hypothetical protein
MANLANRGAKAPTSVSDQQDSQKGLPAAVKECRGVSPPWLPAMPDISGCIGVWSGSRETLLDATHYEPGN